MSKRNTLALTAIALAMGAVSLGGCATEDFVRKQVATEDGKLTSTQADIAAHEGRLQAHEARLGDVDRTAHEALDRAQAAGKLAEGKFLYSVVLSDDSVKFPTAGTELSPEAKTRLMDFVQKLKDDNKNVFLEIQGHTDNRGSKSANRRIGEERADAVRIFLNQQGVALNRMSTISYGDSAPLAPNKTRAERAQNRRVVLIVLD